MIWSSSCWNGHKRPNCSNLWTPTGLIFDSGSRSSTTIDPSMLQTNSSRRNRENHDGKTRLLMGIWLGESLAGVVTYDYIDWDNRAALIGFWLGKSFEGKGIMTRTCSALVDLAFDDLGLNRVEISCANENTRCRMVPERLGFKHEGVSRQRERIYDHFVDTVRYSMLASEWKNRTV